MYRDRSPRRSTEPPEQPLLGELLREKRQAAGISLGEMARRLQRAKSTLSAAETGVTYPSHKLVKGYEKVLQLPPGSLASRHNPIAGLIEAARGSNTYEIVDGVEAQDVLPSELEVVEGVRNSLRQAIALIAAAADKGAERGEQDEILITFLGNQETFDVEQGLHERWVGALCRALDAGYRVVHIWRPGASTRQHVDLIKELLRLLHPSWHYEPYYVPAYDPSATAPSDLVIVPHQGALQLFSTYQSQHVDSAFFFPASGKHFEILRRHFTLRQAHAEPLLKTYTASAFDEALLAAEQQEGEEILLLHHVSFKLMPGYVHTERVRRILTAYAGKPESKRALEVRLQRALRINERRRRRFEERLAGWPVYHIGSKQTLERMVKVGDYTDGWIDEFGASARLLPEEIVACIRQEIHDLQLYPHYEVALVEHDADLGTFQNFWEVIGNHTALFAVLLQRESGTVRDKTDILSLSTRVPIVVQAMRDFFFQKWHELLPKERDKNRVIAWLQALIARS